MKTRGRKPKAANAVSGKPDYRDQEHREIISGPQTTSNIYSHALHYFFTVQNNHLTRLRYLFPEINPAALKRILDLCQGDFIGTVDKVLGIRRNDFIHEIYGNKPSSAGPFGSRTTAAHPNASTQGSSNFNSTTLPGNPFVTPMAQTYHKVPSFNQTMPPNYHNAYPVIPNNPVLMQTPVFDQVSNFSAPSHLIENYNKFSEPVSCPAVPKRKASRSSVQMARKYQPSTEQFQPILPSSSPYCDMPEQFSYEINNYASNVHGQYVLMPPHMVRPNLIPADKQDSDVSHLTAHDVSEQPKSTADQASHRAMPEAFANQRKGGTFQQHQDQYDENQILDFLNNIQPLVNQQSQQNIYEANAPVLPPPTSHDTVTTPIQTATTTAEREHQEGKFEDEPSKSSTSNDGGQKPDVDVTQKQMFTVTSDANLNKLSAKGSVQWQQEHVQQSVKGRNRTDFVDETSPSEESYIIIDANGEPHNPGHDVRQVEELVMAKAQSQ